MYPEVNAVDWQMWVTTASVVLMFILLAKTHRRYTNDYAFSLRPREIYGPGAIARDAADHGVERFSVIPTIWPLN